MEEIIHREKISGKTGANAVLECEYKNFEAEITKEQCVFPREVRTVPDILPLESDIWHSGHSDYFSTNYRLCFK